MSGPAPKHPSTRARRNDPKKGFRVLSIEGRAGPTPPWPLQVDVAAQSELEVARDRVATLQVEYEDEEDGRKRGRIRRDLNKHEMLVAKLTLQIEQARDAELALWADLWAMPQAEIWAETHAHREVAQYVRWKIHAEQGNLKAATEARMLSDRLGLNPLALLRLRAEVEQAGEREERRQQRAAKPQGKTPPGVDPRGGLHAV